MAAPIPAGFYFPAGATAPLAARVTEAIYAAPSAADLLPYAAALDTQFRAASSDGTASALAPGRPAPRGDWTRALVATRYPRWAGDVLLVGECRRAAEVALMARILDGVVRSGRTVLYLSTSRGEHAAMHRHRRDAGWPASCALARCVAAGRDRLRAWLHGSTAQLLRDGQRLAPLLAANGAALPRAVTWAVRDIAAAKLQWAALRRRLAFHAAITRANYTPLSAALLADCFATGHLSISLQHSIVTCPSSFAPLLPRRYLCFGSTSQAVLRDLDAQLSQTPRQVGTGCELVAAGSFLDPMPPARTPSSAGSVLVVDQSSDWAPRFYGGGSEPFAALHGIVPSLARTPAVRRVVVRLHPSGVGARAWSEIAARFPDRVVLGPWQRPLHDDVREASAVVGLFSTVLPTAAAAGVPTFFVWQPGWFSTPDLAPFAATQFVEPAQVVERIPALLSDPNRLAAEGSAARAAAERYFSAGRCDFSSDLIEYLLRPGTPARGTPQPCGTSRTPAAAIQASS